MENTHKLSMTEYNIVKIVRSMSSQPFCHSLSIIFDGFCGFDGSWFRFFLEEGMKPSLEKNTLDLAHRLLIDKKKHSWFKESSLNQEPSLLL